MVMKIADGRANDAGEVESEQPPPRHDQGDSDPSFHTSGPSEGGFFHRLHLTQGAFGLAFLPQHRFNQRAVQGPRRNTLYLTIAYAAATPSFQLIFFPWS